jgi:hypothetical protein
VDDPRPLEALMFRPSRADAGAPDFRVVDERKVNYFRWLGWFLLAKESDVRFADLDDVRREDEQGRR